MDFLDIHSKITGNIWKFDIYPKPTNPFMWIITVVTLTHIKNEISLLLTQRLVLIVGKTWSELVEVTL